MSNGRKVSAAPVVADEKTEQAVLRLEGVRKSFRRAGGGTVAAIDDTNLAVGEAEIVVLLGPSGCGKTTLLRAVAGLEHPDAGRIVLDDKVMYSSKERINVAPEKRPVGMVFQQYALWPHMSVFQNVAYPLRARKVPRKEIQGRVMDILKAVRIDDLAHQHPGAISGGQQQRVALARAIVAGDRMVLFDEPLSNVDAKVRERLRIELLTMHAEIGFAALYVTHDQAEAMALADRIAVLDTGRVVQLATPREIYETPASRSVADFIGTANEITGVVKSVDDATVTVATAHGVVEVAAREQLSVGDDVVLVWRPERGEIGPGALDSGGLRWDAEVVAEIFTGPTVSYLLKTESGTCEVTRTAPLAHEGCCEIRVPGASLLAFRAGDAAEIGSGLDA